MAQTLEERQDYWRLNFLNEYVKMKLGLGLKNEINVNSVEYDKRRTPTVRKYLISLGWISENCYSILRPIEKEIEKVLPDYAEKPIIKANGKKKVYGYGYSSEKEKIYKNLEDAFISLEAFCREELKGSIYLYLHQDEYKFIDKTEIITSKFGSTKTSRTYKAFYPKELIGECDKGILHAHAEKYALENPKEILRYIFNLNFKYIGEGISPYDFSTKKGQINTSTLSDSFKIADEEKLFFEIKKDNNTLEVSNDIPKKLSYLEFAQKIINRAIKEWKVLNRKITLLGGNDKFKEKLIESTLDYFQFKALVWGSNGNDTQKKIAKIIITGTSSEEE